MNCDTCYSVWLADVLRSKFDLSELQQTSCSSFEFVSNQATAPLRGMLFSLLQLLVISC